mmetsp:Transcript_31871/g.77412  ORF Transcript_31871/g.77412 Transcript_31871/m.77412 type:complete len:238 (-) Transcript_31871:260-973(-)
MMIPIEEMTHKELLLHQRQRTTDVAMTSSSSSSSPAAALPSPATSAIENSLRRFSEMQSGRTKLEDVDVDVDVVVDHKIIPSHCRRHRRMITFDAAKPSEASASTSASKASALSSLKRSRPSSTKTTTTDNSNKSCCSSSFDMSTFEQASNEVQDSLRFPMIEWPTTSDDDDDSNDDDDDKGTGFAGVRGSSLSRSRKRVCRGLVRSSSTIDLSSFLVGTRTAVAVTAASRCRRSSC